MKALLPCELGLAVKRMVHATLGIGGLCPKDVLVERRERQVSDHLWQGVAEPEKDAWTRRAVGAP